jgi:hypothetical protein
MNRYAVSDPVGSTWVGRGALAQLVERLHGMQEVRGSNPLSSTIYADQRHISILEMIFDFLHRNIPAHPARAPASTHVRHHPLVPNGSQSRRKAVFREPNWEPMVSACPAASTQEGCPVSVHRARRTAMTWAGNLG